ncbi:uncharacterized protein LOC128545841 [Mercenaria mercenaria]|uniref:uncharacterized protein LOC128545841 n=1 Tax=Mercenaria mercenaria TaxID=6596 RepID=UPI00234F8103|nr:uncharacterized protein LOC128545841 [Mercenaria mercenaria]
MAVFRRYKIKQWIYRSIYVGVLLFATLQLKSKEIDNSKLAPLTSLNISRQSSFEESKGNTHQNQTPIPDIGRPLVVPRICRILKTAKISDGWPFRGKLLFVRDRPLYYCSIPKCGSTFMDHFLSVVFRCNGLCDHISISTLRTNMETPRLMSNAYSFMFVREPYARLFSAYENKLFLPNQHWTIIGADVIRTERPYASLVSKMLGHDVTFIELVKYVLNLYERGVRLNDHLAPMHMHCDSCEFKFNFIGKMENMSSDLVRLVEDWKSKGIVSKSISSAKEIEANMLYKRSFGPYKHMFLILKQYGSVMSRYKLFQRAWSSYQIRGLILKKYNMPFAEHEVAKINYIRFGDEIKKALDASMGHEDELKAQRKEAVVQAYKTVPMELMMKLREFMKPDCLLFGYDVMPEFLFNRTSLPNSDGFDYFKGL